MLFLMITFLMIQLQSFSRLFLVLIVVPMAMSGVVAGLLIFQRPLGFVAILGILALIGMVARNAVILIEQIEAELSEGRPAWEAVIEATVSRFRHHIDRNFHGSRLIPIAATIFWGPMAFAIMGGFWLALSSRLSFYPRSTWAWFRIKESPARDEVLAQAHGN